MEIEILHERLRLRPQVQPSTFQAPLLVYYCQSGARHLEKIFLKAGAWLDGETKAACRSVKKQTPETNHICFGRSARPGFSIACPGFLMNRYSPRSERNS